jgi:hypothetical protein
MSERLADLCERDQHGTLCALNLSLCLAKHYARNTHGKWRYRSTILYLSSGWKWVAGFMPWYFYHRGKAPRHPLYRRWSGPQSRSGHCGEIFIAPTGSRSPAAHPVAHRWTDWSIPAQNYCKKLISFVTRTLSAVWARLTIKWTPSHSSN